MTLRFIFLLITIGTLTSIAAEPLVLIDLTGRGFAPELIHYQLADKSADPNPFHFVDEQGGVYPVQRTADGTISFVTDLPANSTKTLTPRPGPLFRHAIYVNTTDVTEFATDQLAVRLPAPTADTFANPVLASTLPAPILFFRPDKDSPWLGNGKLISDRLVKTFRVEILAKGPVFAEQRYRIDFTDGGFYQHTIRVVDQLPMAIIQEEFDAKTAANAHAEYVVLDLTSNWSPDTVEVASHNGNGGGDPKGSLIPLADFFAKQQTHYLVGDQCWRPRINHLGLWAKAAADTAPAAHPLVAVVPLYKGRWRRATSQEVVSGDTGTGSLAIRFPLGTRNLNWIQDGTSEVSPYGMNEHDPSLPVTYGRRVWGLALGHSAIPNKVKQRPTYQLHRMYGNIGLDRYKDYLLTWPQGDVTYPRLTKADLPAATDEEVKRCLTELRKWSAYYLNTYAASHHHTAHNYDIAFLADHVLAKPDLAPDIRQEIRSRLALIAHYYSEGDMMSYGNGYHHGNPNMGTARFWSGPTFAALIPDHPSAKAWAEHLLAYGMYNLSTQIAPEGAYIEFGAAYHMHGFARSSNGMRGLTALAGLDATRPLYEDYVNPCWRYYMNLLTPFESRWQSRVIPGLANSQPGNTKHLIEAAASVAPTDPQLASHLSWAWNENGHNKTNPLLIDPAITPKKADLTSQYYPGLGIIFRAHQGIDETWFFMRSGFNWSHWYIDPGHFLFMSRGATLVPFQPFQYANSSDPGYDPNNTIRFGHPENQFPYGWPDGNILDYTFTPSVDYAWSSTGFPDWYIAPGQSPEWTALVGTDGTKPLDDTYTQKQGAFTWDRQVMLMKGPTPNSTSYLVIRDSTTGPGQLSSYLNLRLLGAKDKITTTPAGYHVDTQWDLDLDLTFLQPTTATYHEQLFRIATHNSNIKDRVKDASKVSPDWIKDDGTPWTKAPHRNMNERHTIMRIPAPPGQGYTWVVYPRRPDQLPPTITDLGNGMVKIAHQLGTDYVLLSRDPKTRVEAEGVTLEGQAAVLRTRNDQEAEYIVAAFPGSVSYKERTLIPGGDKTKVHALESKVTLTKMYEVMEWIGPPQDPGKVTATDDSVRFTSKGHNYVELTHGNLGIRGRGPFDLTFTNDAITGTVSGEKRTLAVSWPEGITRPMFTMDNKRYFAGWADEPSLSKSPDTPQLSLAFAVSEGSHTIEISEWIYPPMPPIPTRTTYALQAK